MPDSVAPTDLETGIGTSEARGSRIAATIAKNGMDAVLAHGPMRPGAIVARSASIARRLRLSPWR